MTRVVCLKMDEGKVVAWCLRQGVGVSAIERLPTGGVRLVCKSVDGAKRIRAELKPALLDDRDSSRERHRPATPMW